MVACGMDLRTEIAARWREQGYSCDLWVDPPGQVWADFVHDVDERVQVLEGELEMTSGGVTRRLGPGDETFIPAHAPHTVKNVGGTTACWLHGYRKSGGWG